MINDASGIDSANGVGSTIAGLAESNRRDSRFSNGARTPGGRRAGRRIAPAHAGTSAGTIPKIVLSTRHSHDSFPPLP